MKQKNYYYQLQSCVWEITLACCFSCKYCGSKAGIARENELSTEECLDIAKQLANMGCRRVSMIGGEVFMRSDWYEIVKALTDRGVRVSIITNGHFVSDRLISALKKAQIESVAVSIDGPERIHDSFRQNGSFKKAMQTVDVLTQNGIPVSVISTLHSKNVLYLEEMYDVLKDKNIFAWQLQACSPMGNAVQGEFSTMISFGDVIQFVEEHLAYSKFSIGVADNIGYYTKAEGYLRGNVSGRAVFLGCRAGLSSIGIDSIGNVRGCESMYDEFFIEGNLREKSLYEIWNDPDAFSYNRNFHISQLSGSCRECKHNMKCAGGCRSYNYFSHGKMYESPNCAKLNEKPDVQDANMDKMETMKKVCYRKTVAGYSCSKRH